MRSIHHAFFSITRKPTKAIVTFTILWMVFTLIFTSIIIQNTLQASKDYTRRALGGTVEMRLDFIKAFQDEQGASNEGKQDIQSQMQLPMGIAKEISKDPRIQRTYLEYTFYTGSTTLLSGQPEPSDNGFIATSSAISSGEGTPFELVASSQDVPMAFDKNLKLIEGRFRTAEDKGQNTLLVTKEVASKNNLRLGDTLSFKLKPDGLPIQFTIIGIFEGAPAHLANQLYFSEETLQREAPELALSPSRVAWALKDPFDIPDFTKQYSPQMPSKYLYLDANNEQYYRLTKPLDVMSTIVTLLLLVIFISGALIILAIVTLFVRERQFEVGLHLANGESKASIVAQFAFEILFVAALAFALSFALSLLTSDFVAQWIAQNQLVEDPAGAAQSLQIFTSLESGAPSLTLADLSSNFRVRLDLITTAKLALSSLGLLAIAMGAPLALILSYKPRKSLQY